VGLLLGDGRNTAATTPASALEDGRRGGVIVAPPVTTSSTRFIPEQYLLNTPDVRQAVLQGLLDADRGSVRQAGRSCRIRYTTRSSRLRDDVVFLVRSLGGVADCPVDVRSDAYVIDIRLPDGGRPTRMIESIEPAGEAECVCIAVSAEDSLYVTEDFLVTHNSLNDAFVVLDEAQNTSAEQMKMFLTRLGFGSQMVVTGDVTQIDLPAGTRSGLKIVQDILDGIEDVHFCRLTSQDVVRHRLVSEIVDAYAKWDAENNAAVTQQPASPRRRTGR
jgi:phosphate starvation-inducible PhoH-like protein